MAIKSDSWMPTCNDSEHETLEKQCEILREALNDIVNASRDEGLAKMCNWMRGRAVVGLTDAHEARGE